MTPVLSAVYDELLARASKPPFRSRADALREEFLRRTAASSVGENVWAMIAARRGGPSAVERDRGPLGTPHLRIRGEGLSSEARSNPEENKADIVHEAAATAEREERTIASWDDALTRGGLAAEMAPDFPDASERALVRVVSFAQRGVFRLRLVGGKVSRLVAIDSLGGGEFLMLERDSIIREVPDDTLDSVLFDGRIVAASDGCSILPGVIFHPPDALDLVDRIVAAGRKMGLGRDQICDILLRMQDAFVAGSRRVKIGFAYNPEALAHMVSAEGSSAA